MFVMLLIKFFNQGNAIMFVQSCHMISFTDEPCIILALQCYRYDAPSHSQNTINMMSKIILFSVLLGIL